MEISFVVIDDTAFIREILKGLASSIGYTYIGEADNGEDGIDLVATQEPDLVFLDMVMPKINGIDTAIRMKSTHPDLKIIGCSSLDNKVFIQNALDAGFDYYLQKPFTREQFLQAVKKVMPESQPENKYG